MFDGPHTNKVIDLTFLPALKVLITNGLPAPLSIEVSEVTLCGQSRPDIVALGLNEKFALGLRTAHSPVKVTDIRPEQWSSSALTATTQSGRKLVIDSGAVDVVAHRFVTSGTAPHTTTAQIYGWAWHTDDDPSRTVLWAARIHFSSPEVPIGLYFPTANLGFECGEESVRGWQFNRHEGPIFLVLRDEEWFIAFGQARMPERKNVMSALSSIGFAFGEDIGIGILHSIESDAIGTGMVVMILHAPGRRSSREHPAIPLSFEDTRGANPVVRSYAPGIADFVERILAFESAHPDAPIAVAINQYFESLDGFVESQFLHAWIAAEAIAVWASERRLLKTVTRGRIADHREWAKWVTSQKSKIESFANAGMEQQLFGRVMESDAGRQNDVHLVFIGEGIPWTQDMDDAETARNTTAHNGVMPDSARNFPLDFQRIGLIRTMLTALIARLVGYKGAILDRGRNQGAFHDEQPAWWTASPLPDVSYVETSPQPP